MWTAQAHASPEPARGTTSSSSSITAPAASAGRSGQRHRSDGRPASRRWAAPPRRAAAVTVAAQRCPTARRVPWPRATSRGSVGRYARRSARRRGMRAGAEVGRRPPTLSGSEMRPAGNDQGMSVRCRHRRGLTGLRRAQVQWRWADEEQQARGGDGYRGATHGLAIRFKPADVPV